MRLCKSLFPLVILASATLLPRAHAQLAQLAAAQQMYVYDIYTMNDDGTNRVRLTDGKSIVQQPAWSPDGKQIAYARDDGRGFDIWLMNIDGSDNRRFTKDAESNEIKPVWTPDGGGIAFVSMGKSIRDAVVMGQSLTSGAPLLMVSASIPVFDPAISPTTSELIVSSLTISMEERKRAYVLSHANKEGLTPISIKRSVFLTQPAWSPDGTRIVARGNTLGFGDIYILNPSTGEITQITDHPGEDRDPVWSPDGQSVLFASDRAGDFDIYSTSVAGMNLRNLTNSPLVDEVEPTCQQSRIAFAVASLSEVGAALPPRPVAKWMNAGRYMSQTPTRLHPGIISLSWSRNYLLSRAYLGKHGELVGIRDTVQVGDAHYLVSYLDDNELVLEHSGKLENGRYASIRSTGIVDLEESEHQTLPFEYDIWPYRDAQGVRPVPADEVVFPISARARQPLIKPDGTIGWLIELSDGSYVMPKQTDQPQLGIIWIVRRGDKSIYLQRTLPLSEVIATTDREGRLVSDSKSESGLFWPYVDVSGSPALPLRGYRVTPVQHAHERFLVRPNGAVALPSLEQ